MAWTNELKAAWLAIVENDSFSGFDEFSEAFEAGWNAALKNSGAGALPSTQQAQP